MHEAELFRIKGLAKGIAIPTWREVLEGVIPPPPNEGVDPSEFGLGWHCFYCSFVETIFREHSILPLCSNSRRALLLS